jgi:hypothetical protein
LKKPLNVFAFLCVAALYAAGCGSHSGAGVPALGLTPLHERRHHHVGHATVYLRIPPKPRRRHQPRWVSPGTQSLTVLVRSASGIPLPLQVFPVATPSPCATIAPSSGGGVQCAFSVTVYTGSDTFAISTYATAAPGPSSSPLSEYVSTAPVPIPSPGGALAFALEGVLDHVVMTYPTIAPSPGASAPLVCADALCQNIAFPAGAPTSAPLTVTPYDAAGYQILAQMRPNGSPVPYFKPITLQVLPAGQGVTLRNDAGSGGSVTIAGPNDLAVSVQYDGTASVASGGVVSNTSFTILEGGTAPTARGAQPMRRLRPLPPGPSPTPTAGPTLAPNIAYAALASNALAFPILTYAPSPSSGPPPLVLLFSGNAFDYIFSPGGSPPTATIGTFSPASPEAGQHLQLQAPLMGGLVDSFGDLWVAEASGGYLDCYNGFTSSLPAQRISLSTLIPSFNPFPAAITEDASSNLWFGFGAITFSPSIAFDAAIGYAHLNASCSAGTPSVSTTPVSTTPNVDARAPVAGGPGAWFADASNALLLSAQPGPSSNPAPAVSPTSLPTPITGLATYGTTTYALQLNGVLSTLRSGGALNNVAVSPFRYVGAPVTIASTGRWSAIDASLLGFDLFDPPTNSALLVPMPGFPACTPAAFDASALPWTLCTQGNGTLVAYKTLLTPTWSILPGTVIALDIGQYCPTPATVDLGIVEAYGLDSGPFTVTSSNPLVVSVSTTPSPAGLDHEIGLQVYAPSSPAPANLTVTDAHGRTVLVAMSVTSDSSGRCYGISPAVRRQRESHRLVR